MVKQSVCRTTRVNRTNAAMLAQESVCSSVRPSDCRLVLDARSHFICHINFSVIHIGTHPSTNDIIDYFMLFWWFYRGTFLMVSEYLSKIRCASSYFTMAIFWSSVLVDLQLKEVEVVCIHILHISIMNHELWATGTCESCNTRIGKLYHSSRALKFSKFMNSHKSQIFYHIEWKWSLTIRITFGKQYKFCDYYLNVNTFSQF